MLLKIVYLLVRRILGLAVLVFRTDLVKDAQLLVLRHESAVLRRHVGRVRYEPADRVWLAPLARLIPRRRWTDVSPVTPVLTEYQAHYNTARPHQGIAQRVPDGGRVAPCATVTDIAAQQVQRQPVFGGLINEYTRAA